MGIPTVRHTSNQPCQPSPNEPDPAGPGFAPGPFQPLAPQPAGFAAAAPAAPARRPWYRKTWVLVVAAFFVGGGVGSAFGDSTPDTAAPAPVVSTSAVATPVAAVSTSSAEAEASASAASASAEAEASRSAEAEASASAEAEASKAAKEEKARKAAKDPSTYKSISARDWARLEKDADTHAGEKYVIYGYVTQADSATGTDYFRADTGGTKGDWYDYDVNTIVTADSDKVKKVVADDILKLYVEVVSSYSYDTSIGGTATAVLVQANIIKHLGTTDD